MSAGPRPPVDGPIRVIVNPSAGSKAGLPITSSTATDVEAVLDHVGLTAEVVESRSPDETRELTGEAVQAGFGAVVAAGGDGTVALVATELMGTSTALGVLPLGTVMNIARMLGLPRDLAGAATVLQCGVVRKIDVGQARGRPFFESASVGMNAAVFREAERFTGGKGGSVLQTIWVAIRYRPARMQIELDDRIVETRALTVTIANGPYTGAGMTVAPEARLDDGRFDVAAFEHFSKWELARHFASIAFGRRVYAPRLSTFRSRFVRISSVHALPARADSRDLGTTPVEFRVRPAALDVIVPAPTAAEGDAGAEGDSGSARQRS